MSHVIFTHSNEEKQKSERDSIILCLQYVSKKDYMIEKVPMMGWEWGLWVCGCLLEVY
jgi:hypothetical protein